MFGGRSNFPGGSFKQEVGFNTPKNNIFGWGSISQSGTTNLRGTETLGPVNYAGGINYQTPAGSGMALAGQHVPKQGSQATASGNLNLVNIPNHQVNAFANHTKTFDTKLQKVGHGTTSAGVNYQHSNGAQGFITGKHTPGQPNSGTIGGSVPLYNNGQTGVDLSGRSIFIRKMKPNHEVVISVKHPIG